MLGKIRIFFWITYGVWLAAFVVLPILLVLYQSLHDVHGRWTLENFSRFFSPVYLRMAGDSLWYAFWITFLSLVVAYPAALSLVRLASRDFWLVALILPSWVNLFLKAYAFLGILSEHGPVNALFSLVGLGSVPLLFTDLGFVLVSVYIFIPFMILPIFNAIRAIPAELIDAARDLGASPLQVVRRVIWPLSLPGVRAGVQATFIHPCVVSLHDHTAHRGKPRYYLGDRHRAALSRDGRLGDGVGHRRRPSPSHERVRDLRPAESLCCSRRGRVGFRAARNDGEGVGKAGKGVNFRGGGREFKMHWK